MSLLGYVKSDIHILRTVTVNNVYLMTILHTLTGYSCVISKLPSIFSHLNVDADPDGVVIEINCSCDPSNVGTSLIFGNVA